MTVSNEHPDALARLVPSQDLKDTAKESVKRCKSAELMHVKSEACTDLRVNMEGAALMKDYFA